MRRLAWSRPGSPDSWTEEMPGSRPASTCETFVAGALRRSSPLMAETADVSDDFFAVP